MASQIANPSTLTLRLKHHNVTVFLNADPEQSLASLKAKLLSTLQQTYPDGINGKPLPSSPSHIFLAVPANSNETKNDWVRVSDQDQVKASWVKEMLPVAFKWDDVADDDENEAYIIGDEEEWDVLLPMLDQSEDDYTDN